MFTPPPSPMPDDVPLARLDDAAFPFPRQSTRLVDPRTSRTPPELKKRRGRRILFLVALLPAALILSASLRHYLCISVLDEPPLLLAKRSPQTLATPPLGTPTPTPTLTLSTLSVSSATASASASTSATASTSASASAPPTIPTAPTIPTPFPQPFDANSISSNFTTQGCEAFFANFTQEEDFRQCRAFSFLLNASAAFIHAQRDYALFNDILWGTCNTRPTADACAAKMASYLTTLSSACKLDIANQNPAALQAQVGFQSYAAMRSAACLEDPSTNAYCYIDAVAATSPADIYFYALPFGTPLPASTRPSCSPCVRSVLSVYAQYVDAPSGTISVGTGNSTATLPGQGDAQASPLPLLSKTYPAAARLAVDQCGGTYASVGVARASGARRRMVDVGAWPALLAAVLLAGWAR